MYHKIVLGMKSSMMVCTPILPYLFQISHIFLQTLKPSPQLLHQISKVLKLTKVKEVVFGLALTHSASTDLKNFGECLPCYFVEWCQHNVKCSSVFALWMAYKDWFTICVVNNSSNVYMWHWGELYTGYVFAKTVELHWLEWSVWLVMFKILGSWLITW